MNLKEEYPLRLEIVKRHLEAWNIRFDDRILPVVTLLLCHGFSVRIPYGNPNRKKKLLFPRIEIKFVHSIKFHLEEERMETVLGNAQESRRQLEELIIEFNKVPPLKLCLVDCSLFRRNPTMSVILCNANITEVHEKPGDQFLVLFLFRLFLLKNLLKK